MPTDENAALAADPVAGWEYNHVPGGPGDPEGRLQLFLRRYPLVHITYHPGT